MLTAPPRPIHGFTNAVSSHSASKNLPHAVVACKAYVHVCRDMGNDGFVASNASYLASALQKDHIIIELGARTIIESDLERTAQSLGLSLRCCIHSSPSFTY